MDDDRDDDDRDDDDRDDDERGVDRSRREGQLRLILAGLEGVGVDPPDWERSGEVHYLFREGVVLVRDRDLPRVREVLPGRTSDALLNGLTSYAPELPTLEALALLDRELGVGVATPDHVMYVTSHVQSFCPATEPVVPAKGTVDPDPPLSDEGPCDGDGVRVSVVDTGWWPPAEAEHTWLAGVTGDVEVPFDPAGQILPYGGHGTFAAGVVRATAPRSTVRIEGIMPVVGAAFESDVVRQLYDALEAAPDIISLQAGTTTRGSAALLGFEVLWQTRLRHLSGTVLVAAAGNNGNTVPFWPAAFEWAVAVGALDSTETHRTAWSNHGPWVDVYARGEDLVNAYLDGTFVTLEPQSPAGEHRAFTGLAQWSGTSFSTPYVAGLVAARASRTGESGRAAADALLALARRHALPKIGPVVHGWMGCPGPQDDDDACCTGCWRHGDGGAGT